MSKLLYHAVQRTNADCSPFDDAILNTARGAIVRIASPYIGLSYLERIIDAASDWTLISDIEAWLSSLSTRARPSAWSFMREHIDKIHHCPGLHAKVVVGEQLAVFGSANLTFSGIQARTELGMLLTEPTQVLELASWFDGIWSTTASPFVDETNAFIEWLDEISDKSISQRQKFLLAPETQVVRAKLVCLDQPTKVSRNKGIQQLDLSTVAKKIVSNENRHYLSVEAAFTKALDALAPKGFGLADILSLVCEYSPEASVREVYFLLILHSANHPRSVFSKSTINRLLLCDGRFQQSNAAALAAALRRYDEFLVMLIRHLQFDHPNQLPSESHIAQLSGINEVEQLLLIGELLDAGFLLIDDRPGELPLYELSEDFEWNGRYRLFQLAHQAWLSMRDKPRPTAEFGADDDVDNDLIDYREEQQQHRRFVASLAKTSGKDRSLKPVSRTTYAFSDIDSAQAAIAEWLISSPNQQRVLPKKKPGRVLRSLGISPEMASKLLGQKTSSDLLHFDPVLTGECALSLKQPCSLDETKCPKTAAVLRKYGRL